MLIGGPLGSCHPINVRKGPTICTDFSVFLHDQEKAVWKSKPWPCDIEPVQPAEQICYV